MGRLPGAVLDMEEEEEELLEMKERRIRERFTDLELEEEEEDERFLDFEDAKGKLHLWIKEPKTVRWIRRKFKNFLAGYKETDRPLYLEKIHEMCQSNRSSLIVDITHIAQKVYTLALWIQDEPGVVIPYLNAVAFELAVAMYPHYE